MHPAAPRASSLLIGLVLLAGCEAPAPPRPPPPRPPPVQFGQEIYPGGPVPSVRPSVFGDAPAPRIERPVLFGTPEADRILERMAIFPPDNPWNEDVSALPVHPDSGAIIASIGADTHLDFNLDMNFIVVPPGQRRVPVRVVEYPAESDKGPFPIPDEAPIENWPLARNEDVAALPKPGQTLAQFQEGGPGDRHLIVVDPTAGLVHEIYQARRTPAGWLASQASTFDLTTNVLRPLGWTSADAAGLPIFPAIVRYDEVAKGMVRHALRVTVSRSRRAFVYPATHFASQSDDPHLPRMGERLRLRASFDVTRFPPHARAVLEGLKRHGMFVADNGGDWRISVSPDRRFEGLETLVQVRGRDFEVVLGTGPYDGPRGKGR